MLEIPPAAPEADAVWNVVAGKLGSPVSNTSTEVAVAATDVGLNIADDCSAGTSIAAVVSGSADCSVGTDSDCWVDSGAMLWKFCCVFCCTGASAWVVTGAWEVSGASVF